MMFSQASHLHIYDGNGLVSKLLPIINSTNYIFATIVIGIFLALIFLLVNENGHFSQEAMKIKEIGKVAILVWLISQIGFITVQVATLFQISIADSLQPTNFLTFLLQSGLGQAELISLVASAISLSLLAFARKISTGTFGFGFALLASIAPAFQSHSGSLSNHELGEGAIVVHVIGFTFWIGSLIGVLLISPKSRAIALPRVSRIAWWSAITVVLTGAVNTWLRLTTLNSLTTFYAALIYAKIILTIGLLLLGNSMRKALARNEAEGRYRQLRNEGLIALAVVALGAWLNVSAPPTPGNLFEPSNGYVITGINVPPAPNLYHLLTLINFDGLFLALLIFLGLLYGIGVRNLKRREILWPKGRSIAFWSGWLLALYTTSGGLSIYAHYSFAYHMMAHMLMGMGVPILWTLSAPITLALRTLPTGRNSNEMGPRQILSAILNSRFVKIITNPLAALAIFDGSLFVLYFTPLFGDLMESHTGHFLMNLHFLLAGLLFFFLIIGVDPNPHKAPHVARIVLLAAAMSIHSFFSIALLSSTSLMDHGYFALLGSTWITDRLGDQHAAGAIGWALSDLPIIFALIATFIQWVRDDKKETDRYERRSRAAHQAGEEDELDKFNNYLKKLNSTN